MIGDQLKNVNNRVQVIVMLSKDDSVITRHPNIMEIIVLEMTQDISHVHELLVKVSKKVLPV